MPGRSSPSSHGNVGSSGAPSLSHATPRSPWAGEEARPPSSLPLARPQWTWTDPLVEPRAECLIIASSFDQGLICFRHVQAFLEPHLREVRHRPAGAVQDSGLGEQGDDHRQGDGRHAPGPRFRPSTPPWRRAQAPLVRRGGSVATGASTGHAGSPEDIQRQGAGVEGDLARHPPRSSRAPLPTCARRSRDGVHPLLRRPPRRSTVPTIHVEASEPRPRPPPRPRGSHPLRSRRREAGPGCTPDVPRSTLESGDRRRAPVGAHRCRLMGTSGTGRAGGHGGAVRPRPRPRAGRGDVRGGRVLARHLPPGGGRRLPEAPRPCRSWSR